MTKRPEVIIIHETIAASIVKDIFSIAALTAAIGIGVYLDSTALQWVAAILWLIFGLGRVNRIAANNTFTIPQARARLDAIEREHI